MAAYNGGAFIAEQIDSLLQQSYWIDEIVICDDSGNDDTQRVVDKYSADNISYYRNELTVGIKENFARAISRCSGDVVLLCDQDDVWFPRKVEKLVDAFMINADLLVVTNDQVIADGELNTSCYTKLGNVRHAGLPDLAMITGCCTAFRREWAQIALPIPDVASSHDGWICGLADQLGVRQILDVPLQLYRRHGHNSSHWEMSNPRKPSKLWAFWRHGMADAREGWRGEIALLTAYSDRIKDQINALTEMGLADKAEVALTRSAEKCEALRSRIAAVSVGRLRRFPYLLRLWGAGTYSHFDGWKSFAKDLVRAA